MAFPPLQLPARGTVPQDSPTGVGCMLVLHNRHNRTAGGTQQRGEDRADVGEQPTTAGQDATAGAAAETAGPWWPWWTGGGSGPRQGPTRGPVGPAVQAVRVAPAGRAVPATPPGGGAGRQPSRHACRCPPAAARAGRASARCRWRTSWCWRSRSRSAWCCSRSEHDDHVYIAVGIAVVGLLVAAIRWRGRWFTQWIRLTSYAFRSHARSPSRPRRSASRASPTTRAPRSPARTTRA